MSNLQILTQNKGSQTKGDWEQWSGLCIEGEGWGWGVVGASKAERKFHLGESPQ